MKEKVWHINPETKQLVSAYSVQPYAKRIVAAQPFTVSLQSVVVADDLDGWPRGDNDLLLTTCASLGEAPKVQRVHYYAEEIKPKTVLKDFYAPTMFVSPDYSGTERLWLELKILEIDTDTGDRKALTSAFNKVAATAGAVFPVAMPYAALASGVVTAVEKRFLPWRRTLQPSNVQSHYIRQTGQTLADPYRLVDSRFLRTRPKDPSISGKRGIL